MISIVMCNHCGKSGSFEVEYTFKARQPHCGECLQERHPGWKFNFCTNECFRAWWEQNKVEKRGVPCQECLGLEGGHWVTTGFAFGMKENGSCPYCKGEKAVRRQLKGDPVKEWTAEKNRLKGGQ